MKLLIISAKFHIKRDFDAYVSLHLSAEKCVIVDNFPAIVQKQVNISPVSAPIAHRPEENYTNIRQKITKEKLEKMHQKKGICTKLGPSLSFASAFRGVFRSGGRMWERASSKLGEREATE